MNMQIRQPARQYLVVLAAVVGLALTGLLIAGATSLTVAAPLAALDGSSKTASADTVSPGAVITYTIVVSNGTGSAVGPVQVTDALPDEVDYGQLSAFVLPEGSASIQFDGAKRNITFTTYSSVGADALVTFGFRAQVDAATSADTLITNTAVISDGSEAISRQVVVQVEEAPTAKILSPWQNQTITERATFQVMGRAWTPSQSPEFPGTPILSDIIYVPGRDWYQVNWSAVSGATSYILEEARNSDFSDASAFAPTSNLFQDITGQSVGTYFYRLKARNAYEDSFWSNVVSVTVTAAPLAWEVDTVAPMTVASYEPVIEVNAKKVGDADNWLPADSVTANPAGDWWDWSFDWDVPEEDDAQYVVQVRGKDLAGTYDPALVDTVTVTVKNGSFLVFLPAVFKRWPPVPYPPNIEIDPDDGEGNYTVKWSDSNTTCPECDPTSFRFQEAPTPDFASPTINEVTSNLQRVFTDKPSGDYYYRVQGINGYGAGDWSATVSPEFQGYFDDFSDTGSGWPRTVYKYDGYDTFDVAYENGTYRAKIMRASSSNGYITNYKMGSVASPWVNTLNTYDVEVRHYFAEADDQAAEPYASKAGLIFGANADFTTIYVLEWNFEGDCSVNKYASRSSPVSDVRIPRTIFKDWGPCSSVNDGYDDWNTATVHVSGNTFKAYINGSLIESDDDNDLGGMHRVGILTGAWNRTPVEGRFDDFSVVP